MFTAENFRRIYDAENRKGLDLANRYFPSLEPLTLAVRTKVQDIRDHRAQKDRFETGFKQKTYGLMVGYDSLTERKKGSVWLLGGAFRYANSDQEALATRQVDGELEQYSVKMYGTWIHDKGSYADIVLQAGRFDQEVNGLDNVGTGTAKADYTTYGFGASVEVGHTFKFSQNAQTNDHWFVEPQFQLSYFYAKGKDYTTSTGLRVEQGNADFLTGRAGAVV